MSRPLHTLSELVQRASDLADNGRALLGIAGAPGAGKSTLAGAIGAALGPDRAVVVGMDGFHLAQQELRRLGRADRKGAPDTFDVGGYLALLRRLRAADEDVVYAPLFRRDLEEPVGSAVPVPASVDLVITEGNYLLVWDEVRELLDECWYVDATRDERHRRLVRRRVAQGSTGGEAWRWALGSDEANAEVVERARDRAGLMVDVTRWADGASGDPAG